MSHFVEDHAMWVTHDVNAVYDLDVPGLALQSREADVMSVSIVACS